MKSTTLYAGGLLLLLATSASGYSGTRDSSGPGGVYSSHAWASGGLTFCERYSDDLGLSGVSPAYCERSGIGGAHLADIGCSADFHPAASPAVIYGNGVPDNAGGCLDDLEGSPAGLDRDGDGTSGETADDCLDALAPTAEVDAGTDCDGVDQFAVGTCTLTPSAIVAGSKFTFVCSTDRDDDGRYSNIDDTSADPDGFDDDFVVGDEENTTVPFCFALDGSTGGSDWDDFQVFIEGRDDNTDNLVGSFYVTVSATSASSCTNGLNLGAHTHATFLDTDIDLPPPPPSGAGGWACAGT